MNNVEVFRISRVYGQISFCSFLAGAIFFGVIIKIGRADINQSPLCKTGKECRFYDDE